MSHQTTIKFLNKPSIAAQQRAWMVIIRHYEEKYGVKLSVTFSSEEKK